MKPEQAIEKVRGFAGRGGREDIIEQATSLLTKISEVSQQVDIKPYCTELGDLDLAIRNFPALLLLFRCGKGWYVALETEEDIIMLGKLEMDNA